MTAAALNGDGLRFGAFAWIDRSEKAPIGDHYEHHARAVELADKAGFAFFHMAEHHGTTLGVAPSPNVFLASLAPRTCRIRMAPLALLLPMYHPVRFIEEIAMLDHLLGGRLELGLSRGVSPFELKLFGVEQQAARGMFREFLDLATRAWREGYVGTFEGEHYQVKDFHLSVQPLQRPYPPLWYPTSNPDSLGWVGEQRFSQLFNYLYSRQATVAEDIEALRRAYSANAGKSGLLNGHAASPTVGILRHVHVAEDDRQAEANVRAAYGEHWSNVQFLWRIHNGAGRHDKMGDLDTIAADGSLIFGGPARVATIVQEELNKTGADYFAGAFTWGGLTEAQSLNSIKLFAEQVAPRLKNPARTAA